MTITIIGAGMAGLLAANMLRHKAPYVLEKQSGLPNNHSAVLRFRSQVVGDVTGIEFKKVNVIKSALHWRNPIADALAYAEKNHARLLSNRSIPTQVEVMERYIAPADMIERLADGVDIRFGTDMQNQNIVHTSPIISTIPMPTLMELLDYPKRHSMMFPSITGSNIRAKVLSCEAYVSLYVPAPFYPFSRVSLTGDELIIEIPFCTEVDEELVYAAAGLLGISRERLSEVHVAKQAYAKIQEIDDGERKRFIAWASDNHNIYSLGRFATWRPKLLTDDLVQDIRLIERWITGGQYAMRVHGQRRTA